MRPEIDLSLLKDSLVQLTETTYFGASLHTFTSMLVKVIDHVIQNRASYHEDVICTFANHVRQSHRYLSGSTTKETPYEVSFCLEKAIPTWVNAHTIITTGLTYGHDFHFAPSDPWNFIKLSITGFAVNNYDPKLIYIGVPRLYVHKPIYCVSLYHELGHFVDMTLGVTSISLLLSPVAPATPTNVSVARSHRMEHFSDLFAACYVGTAGIDTLKTIAPNDPASFTHPATADRVKLVEDFLASRSSPGVDLFRQSLAALGAPQLTRQFTRPDIAPSFDDIRPFDVTSVNELHGLFLSAWEYLNDVLDKKQQSWASNADDAIIEQIVNDLTEKSIRNYAVRERWKRGVTP